MYVCMYVVYTCMRVNVCMGFLVGKNAIPRQRAVLEQQAEISNSNRGEPNPSVAVHRDTNSNMAK